MKMFKLHDQRYTVDGAKLRRARMKKGYTQSQFAYICGWSGAYQWKLEAGRVETIGEATKNIIALVFKK